MKEHVTEKGGKGHTGVGGRVREKGRGDNRGEKKGDRPVMLYGPEQHTCT